MQIRRRTAAFALVIGCSISCATPFAWRLRSNGDDNVIESFDVASNGDFLLLPVRIGGEQFPFVVDTGSAMNVFDKSLEKHLVLTSAVGKPPNGGPEIQLYSSPTAFVGRREFPVTGYAKLRDLSAFRDRTGHDIRGILGMAFLRKHVIEIRFDSGRLSFLKRADESSRTPIAITDDEYQCPIVAVRLPDLGDRPFLVDTGMCAFTNGCLLALTIDALARSGHLEVHPKTSWCLGYDGIHGGYRQVTIDAFSLGDYHCESGTFCEGDNDSLSLKYLSRFNATFDFPSRRLYLTPTNRFELRFPFNETGIETAPRARCGVEVSSVAPGSPGDAAGIRAGDLMLQINGSDARNLSCYQIRAMFCELPNPLRLRIRSGTAEPARDVEIRR